MRSVWICPSRNRPANIARLLNAWDDTRAQSDLVVAVDDDDDQLAAYRELFNDVDPSHMMLVDCCMLCCRGCGSIAAV